MIGPFTHDVPASRVVFAAGSVRDVGAEVRRLGPARVVLVSSRSAAVAAQVIDGDLGDVVVARIADPRAHVPVDHAEQASALAVGQDADAVVAVGGGSAIGLAKAIARRVRLPIVAVPTTYAGSEMTPIWGETANDEKTTGRDPGVLPRTVVYDPELTMALPPDTSAASGMNALAHLVEGLYAPGISPVQALEAVEGVRALGAALPAVVASPYDLAARAEALYGAWLAGRTLGTTGMGVHHKACHVLGGTYGLPHAGVHSALLSYSAAFNASTAPSAMDAVVRGLRSAGREATDAPGGIWDLAREIGAPTSLDEVGFDATSVGEAARLIVAGHPVNPRRVDVDGVRGLLFAALRGDRPGSAERSLGQTGE